eukprot:scaffold1276_cov162-Amphora_coffeaeformis.AAC.15
MDNIGSKVESGGKFSRGMNFLLVQDLLTGSFYGHRKVVRSGRPGVNGKFHLFVILQGKFKRMIFSTQMQEFHNLSMWDTARVASFA